MRDIDGPEDEEVCPVCKGSGEVDYEDDDAGCLMYSRCPECSGLGVINTRATGPSTKDKE